MPLCTNNHYCAKECEQWNRKCNQIPSFTQPDPENRQAQNYTEQKTKEKEKQERAD